MVKIQCCSQTGRSSFLGQKRAELLGTTMTGGSPIMVFKVGECAVYPAHGLARVQRIDERNVGGALRKFYVLQVLENQMTIMVPTENARSVGLRGVIQKSDVDNVYKILKQKIVRLDQSSWNRRFREFQEKLKTGSIYEIAEVLRSLHALKQVKELSFGERKMMEQSKQQLVKELALATMIPEVSIEAEIQSILNLS